MDYFAYGSNCDPAVMRKKGVDFAARRRAVLRGYRLEFNKKALRKKLPDSIGYANINRDEHGLVEGVLYKIDETDLEQLDRSERYPDHYDRIVVQVDTGGQLRRCWTYKAQPEKVGSRLVPLREYLNHLLEAKGFLSRSYYRTLSQTRTYVRETEGSRR